MAGLVNWVGNLLGYEDEAERTAREAEEKEDAAATAGTHEDDKADAGLQTEGMLTKQQLIQLFSTFKTRVATPETKKSLKDAVAKRQPPEEVTTQLQKDILREMGIDGDHGISCFKLIMPNHSQDPEVMFPFRDFLETESMACDEAELPPEEFAKKMEAFKKAQEQQMEMAKLAKNMVDEVQADPKTRDTLMAKARDHNPANASLTDQQIMMNAMQKMALARQKMAEAGLNPDDVMKMAMAAMKDPNFKPPPPVNINAAGQAVPAVPVAPVPNQMEHSEPEGGVISRPPKSASSKKGE